MKFNGAKVGKIFEKVLMIAPAVLIVLGIVEIAGGIPLTELPLISEIPFLADNAGAQWIIFGVLLELLVLGGGFGVRKIYKRYN